MTAWSAETDARAATLLAQSPDPKSAVMPLLYLAMAAEGSLTPGGMREVAERADLSLEEAQTTVGFLLAQGEVRKHGRARGTRYEAV